MQTTKLFVIPTRRHNLFSQAWNYLALTCTSSVQCRIALCLFVLLYHCLVVARSLCRMCLRQSWTRQLSFIDEHWALCSVLCVACGVSRKIIWLQSRWWDVCFPACHTCPHLIGARTGWAPEGRWIRPKKIVKAQEREARQETKIQRPQEKQKAEKAPKEWGWRIERRGCARVRPESMGFWIKKRNSQHWQETGVANNCTDSQFYLEFFSD